MWVGWRKLSTESAGVGEKRLRLTGLLGMNVLGMGTRGCRFLLPGVLEYHPGNSIEISDGKLCTLVEFWFRKVPRPSVNEVEWSRAHRWLHHWCNPKVTLNEILLLLVYYYYYYYYYYSLLLLLDSSSCSSSSRIVFVGGSDWLFSSVFHFYSNVLKD